MKLNKEKAAASSSQSMHECHICKTRFQKRKVLYKHLRNVHDNSQNASALIKQHQTAKKDITKSKQDARNMQREKTKKEAKEKRQAIIQAKRQPKEFNFARDLNRGEVCIKFRFS